MKKITVLFSILIAFSLSSKEVTRLSNVKNIPSAPGFELDLSNGKSVFIRSGTFCDMERCDNDEVIHSIYGFYNCASGLYNEADKKLRSLYRYVRSGLSFKHKRILKRGQQSWLIHKKEAVNLNHGIRAGYYDKVEIERDQCDITYHRILELHKTKRYLYGG
jgi:uncharacterized protein YecT (DUF1311 family)